MASEKAKTHLMTVSIIILIPVLLTIIVFLMVNFGKQLLIAAIGAAITYLLIQLYMIIYGFVEMMRVEIAITKSKRDKKLAEQLSRVQS